MIQHTTWLSTDRLNDHMDTAAAAGHKRVCYCWMCRVGAIAHTHNNWGTHIQTHLLVAYLLRLLLLGCQLVCCQQQDDGTTDERAVNEAEAAQARHSYTACMQPDSQGTGTSGECRDKQTQRQAL